MKRILKSPKSSASGSSQTACLKNHNKSSSSSQVLSMSKEEEGIGLPEDIIRKILCQLPVKTLIRFTCVSKRWRFIIISDPQFAKSHLQLALQWRTLTQRLFVHSLNPHFQSWEYEDNFNGSVIDLTSPYPSKEPCQRAITSCNGLVLLGDSYLTDLVHLAIWNPSTGFFRKIPSPRITIPRNKYGYELDFAVTGFGYVSSTDDYKLVLVVPGDRTHFHVYIFSLKANCWKVIKASHLSSPDFNHYVYGATLSNGAIHWINHRCGVSDPASIYAFDLAEEEFREMPLPVWFPNNDREMRVLLGGCLCVWFKTDARRSEIWGMTEYGVPESWVKLFGFREADLPEVFSSQAEWDLCFVTEDGKIVIKLLESNEFFRIECRKEEKPVCSGRYLLQEVPGYTSFIENRYLYVETLVSVPE
ncbi:F-box protein CPR1-like [Rosa rugosa]|uniref:F-box protein CPR1-like n=1 Tax=Rosa rugosa TaxID=74645 RepID=UPI002B40396E|nr:F-box protein CPR1-like [Rosa rugosa]